ncbi:MAG: hypothetical protein OXC54_06365, partial [Rhodospirillaceae bacterium]|nr:hypothetical protein [Rhodospirillaceae bacterium]
VERGAAGSEHLPDSTETATPIARRPVWFQDDAPVDTPVYQRADLASGASFIGPAVIDQFDSTTIVFPDDKLTVDDAGNIAISVKSNHLAGRQAA